MKINTIYNPFWESTNSLFSLWAARFELNSDVLLLNGDDVFELDVIKLILSNQDEICVPFKIKDQYASEDMKVKIQNGFLTHISKNLSNPSGESVGIRAFRREGVDTLRRSLEKEIRSDNFEKKWYASAIERILQRGHKIRAIDIKNLYWHDVDYPNDLNHAKLNINKITSKKISSNLRVV